MNHASVNRSLGSAGHTPVRDRAVDESGVYPDEGASATSSTATVSAPDSTSSASASASGARSGSRANAAAWLLLVAFVVLVLSVAVPAMGSGDKAGLAALLFMAGLAATFVGIALALPASEAKGRTVFGALVMLAGVVLMYGIVPAVIALGVVLVGAALQIASLPGD